MNILAIHLLTRPDDEREQRSISSISKLEKKGIQYKQIINKVYTELPPKERCARPDAVSMEPGYMLLSPAHYGCYLAHKNGILENFTDDLDGLLIFECDAIFNTTYDDFYNQLKLAYNYCFVYDLLMWNFGPNYGFNIKEMSDFYIINKFLEAHAYYIPKQSKEFMFNFLNNTPWDVFDLLLANNLLDQQMGIFKGDPLVLQAKGYSFLDKKMSMKNGLGINKL